jgi:hypothetical protein
MRLFGMFWIIVSVVFYLWVNIVWEVIKQVSKMLWAIFMGCYQSFFVEPKLDENKYMENKLLEQRLAEAAEQKDYDEELLGKHNRIIKAAMVSSNEMRMRYPYAEELLFEEYVRQFSVLSVDQIKAFEDRIRESHLRREMNYAINGKVDAQYELKDLMGLTPLEYKSEGRIAFKIYKIKNDYILYINNRGEETILQSKDYFTILRTRVKVLEEQRRLSNLDDMISSSNIKSIFNSLVDSTQDFRRNRNGFID